MKFHGLDNLQEWLLKNGFTILENTGRSDYNEAEWHAYRRLPSARECETNGPKIALWIKPYVYSAINYEHCEANITGESTGLWFELKVYAAKPDEVMNRLPEIEAKLVSVNKVILIGNLGRDPELKFLHSGQPVANFSIATSEKWKDKSTGESKEQTEWHNIIMFGKLAEICGQYLKKGSSVFVEGRLQTRKWQDKNGQDRYTTEIIANEMRLLTF